MKRNSLAALSLISFGLVACSGGGGGSPPPPDPRIAGAWDGDAAGSSFAARLAGPNSSLEGYVDDADGVIWSAAGSGAAGTMRLSFDAPGWIAFSLDGKYAASPGGDGTLASTIDGRLQGSGFTGESLHAVRTGAPQSGAVSLNKPWSFTVWYRNVSSGGWGWWLDGEVTSGTQAGSTFNGRILVTDDGVTGYTGSVVMTAYPSGFVSTTMTMDANASWAWNRVVQLETGYVDAAGLHGYGIDAGDEIRLEGVP
jgi:hypothetical protein